MAFCLFILPSDSFLGTQISLLIFLTIVPSFKIVNILFLFLHSFDHVFYDKGMLHTIIWPNSVDTIKFWWTHPVT